MNMFENYDNIPEDYIPCNLPTPPCCGCNCAQTINRGVRTTQTFLLPFNVESTISDLLITYTQGLYVVLSKTLEDSNVIVEEDTTNANTSLLKVILTEEETSLFKPISNTPVKVQIKYVTDDKEEFVTDIFDFQCVESLNLMTKELNPYDK